ncbi:MULTISPECIES: ATP-binding protein [Shewanella]|uniref:ATP-binding protein n=1 Tax=Shewanella TaxID=22 RepID=UPI0011832503|nr:ATP-binding protein [Shewanella algae]MBO2617668.1 hypothetical protein [Shewanella algae]TVK91302.1 hypothetical protein AYJ01_19070 [Shewanella algae]TVK93784.1 hypothetical protein AYJ01_09135 [Shewanella algae]
MRKITEKQRIRDILRTISFRNRPKKIKKILKKNSFTCWEDVNAWVENEKNLGLNAYEYKIRNKSKKGVIVIKLPKEMDFSTNFKSTAQTLTAIRKLTDILDKAKRQRARLPSRAYKLGSVNFDSLEKISTSAALVLTSEISKWNTLSGEKIRPQVDSWSESIYLQFEQLGFFDLFKIKPGKDNVKSSPVKDLNFVKYIKGCCGDSEDAKSKKKQLKKEIIDIVGNTVPKWTILHSGLTEAVTNVIHHAYPVNEEYTDKSWYLTGSFNRNSKEMKIAFFDQGIGIPNSLPASSLWENIVSYFSKLKIDIAEQKRDEVLLKAAVSIDRTSTNKNDRGKGLQDLIEFIRVFGSGYISILSYSGLYKLEIKNGLEKIKTEGLERPIYGTLIVWSVVLNGD